MHDAGITPTTTAALDLHVLKDKQDSLLAADFHSEKISKIHSQTIRND